MAAPIVIVADDFSGAAELAAIAAACGLSAEVHRHAGGDWQADVIALDADARSLDAAAAAQRWQHLAGEVLRRQPAVLYLKVDSVLRGHPQLQVARFLHASGRQRAVLAPANPTRGRTMLGGRYSIDGRPLEHSPLARDPQYPRTTSDVAQLLPGEDVRVLRTTVRSAADLAPTGILVPDAGSLDDLRTLAAMIDETTLTAGAADFFTALLQSRGLHRARVTAPPAPSALRPPVLLVCGSPTGWQLRAGQCQAAGLAVHVWHETPVGERGGNFPPLVPDEAEALAQRLEACGAAVLALGDPQVPLPQAEAMLQRCCQASADIIPRVRPGSLLVEGGATAALLVAALGWQRFGVLPQSLTGVALLTPRAEPSQAPDGCSSSSTAAAEPLIWASEGNRDTADLPSLWVKPGSYSWPEELWHGLTSLARHPGGEPQAAALSPPRQPPA